MLKPKSSKKPLDSARIVARSEVFQDIRRNSAGAALRKDRNRPDEKWQSGIEKRVHSIWLSAQEMRFAHMKRILRLDRLRLRGLSGVRDEVLLTATAQNLRRLVATAGRSCLPGVTVASGVSADVLILKLPNGRTGQRRQKSKIEPRSQTQPSFANTIGAPALISGRTAILGLFTARPFLNVSCGSKPGNAVMP
jgi:hypothetical protein